MILNNNSNSNPWGGIPRAKRGQFSRLRVDASTDFALFWTRDENNHPGLLVEISKAIPEDTLREVRINIHDIVPDVILDNDLRAVTITLIEDYHQDIFLKVCLDLVERVVAVNKIEQNFSLVCARLRKWQRMLSSRSRRMLSGNEVRGLYAELYFIREMLEHNPEHETLLVQGWEGPERIQHDFVLNEVAVEVKSVAGTQKGKVRISSEDQLESHLQKLYLRVYLLTEMLSGNKGESLNGIVLQLSSAIREMHNRDTFELKLAIAGYIDIPEYDDPLFHINESFTYLVEGDFPRITRKQLPGGVESVTYDLVLASIEKYRLTTPILGV